jgi:hypothetical protein
MSPLIGQGGGQPVVAAQAQSFGGAHADVRFDDAQGDPVDPGEVDAVGKACLSGLGYLEVIMSYRKPRDGSELPTWKQDYNAGHRKVRAHVEHALARLKTYKILRDYRRAARTLVTTAAGIATCTTSPWPADRKPVTGKTGTELRDIAQQTAAAFPSVMKSV